MTKTLLIAGTASHVGKSTVAAGLCRLLADRGLDVAPFKAQNMSNNAHVVVRPDAVTEDVTADADGEFVSSADATSDSGATAAGGRAGDRWGEIGVSQFVQARAARITPTTDCNPVLLKPRGDGESQLILDGRPVDHVAAGEYYDSHWERARERAEAAYERLAADADVVVAEGAGSIAEINLHDRDLANVELARFADADVLVLVNIERGGAFASLYGTLELLPADLRERVVGAVITKFRGDPSLLDPGIAAIEDRTGVPVLGVVPYDDPGLPEEDSVALPETGTGGVRGDDDGVPEASSVTIAVPRFPRLSNATDLEALAAEPGVRVAYVPVENPGVPADGPNGDGAAADPLEAVGADAVVLPGSKNTADDLIAVREAGLDEAIRRFDGPVVGICGGYQMLGRRLTNASLESGTERDEVAGMGLLPVETRFEEDKQVERRTVAVDGVGPLAGARGSVTGYEIHAGETRHLEPVERPVGSASAAVGSVLGTYLHGLFDDPLVRDAFLESVFENAGVDRPATDDGSGCVETTSSTGTPYDRAADLVADHVDLDPVGLSER